ncbi:MAG: Helicase, C-terminal:Type III restriction enzyme, res subunit:DEAD/DEAH box helicase, N-terminal [uncultured Acidimicrobiales bacterium]|uniref:Helicase, C-terminal:Type III restriction enzyme, res subunit:DEAD/DEAH box helicase, N-terminal n=1 Tax=uncultured Acidimicrobiales bacterium TaxID=310071 RepID=A0A6J4IIP0_9ACTN|nr:MAG: Helicase, C-terminal:Type III restriction enzyme, res subunit:DEAD/DEAH box helicase, N-terminal [uncultured Acidimicrobiales bacterium]
MDQAPGAGLYEALLTGRLRQVLGRLPADRLVEQLTELLDAESADRISRHVAALLARAIDAAPEGERAAEGVRLARAVVSRLESLAAAGLGLEEDAPLDPGRVLHAVLPLRPDGTPEPMERPLTPLLDTTVLTNAPGEPVVGHELRAEVPSADGIDVVMAFIRFSGIRALGEALRRHCRAGKALRVLTTTYTNSTEQRALDALQDLGADVRVSYDTSSTRLHAKAWIFHRGSGYSTAYVGSSNLTHMAQVTGLEWNVRISGARNPDAVAKMAAVFTSYWASRDFVAYDADEFRQRTAEEDRSPGLMLSPVEIELRPFQDRLLEQLAVSRAQGHHRNLLVAATGTGKTVMAAVDFAGLRSTLPRDRLLFVAHREEILDQSRATFRHALRDATFGEKWVGRDRPTRFEHVFASIQSLNASGVDAIEPAHFDVVIVDEFHHAAARSYEALLAQVRPRELLGLTATPERADGLDVLRHFDGRIAAELRLWDAIDQHYLAPFDYFGIHDGMDLRDVPWRRGRGYDVAELTNVFTADHAWARRVLEQVRRKVTDPSRMRALGFCVSIDHARFMAERFREAGIPAVAIWGDSPRDDRQAALRDLDTGRVGVVFTVDLFNEGVDVPTVDTLLLLRPTDSPTLFLQQLGRGLRKAPGKAVCTVLDFVGTHRKEFRYDRRFRALLGGSRKDVERQVEHGFPFLPAGCNLALDPVAQGIVLRSIRNAIPSVWRDKWTELRSLGDVSLARYLEHTGLEVDDLYAANHSWTEMRRAAGLPTAPAAPNELPLLRAVGRLLHVDDPERIAAYRSFVAGEHPPNVAGLDERNRRLLRMLVGSITTLRTSGSSREAAEELWQHPQVRAELGELLDLLASRINHLQPALDLDTRVPLRAHARYTRTEILAAFGVGEGAKPPTWQSGVWWERTSGTDLFAFTLDKSVGGFSPTTRYRDYAISRDLIHWESQSSTSADSDTGRRYIDQTRKGTKVVLFGRLRADHRAFWCLGTAHYRSHEGDRPIAFVWKLDHPLPADLYTSFAAAVA